MTIENAAAASDESPSAGRAPRVGHVTDGYWTHPADAPPEAGRFELPPDARLDAAAVRAFVASSGAEVLWLDLDPDRMAAVVEQVAPLGLPLLLPAPFAGTPAAAQRVRRALQTHKTPALVATRLPYREGVRRAASLARRGQFEGLTAVTLHATCGLRGFEQAVREKRDHDALRASLVDVLATLHDVGAAPVRVTIERPEAAKYWSSLALSFETASGARGVVTLASSGRSEPRDASLVLESPGARFEWRGAAKGEEIALTAKGRRHARQVPSAPWPSTPAEALVHLARCGTALDDELDELAPLLELADELADDYLYGHVKGLKQETTGKLITSLRRPDSFWKDFTPTSPMGFDVSLMVDMDKAGPFLEPLSRPLRVLLVRAPVMNPRALSELFPPLALAQLAAAGNRAGATTDLVDLALDLGPIEGGGEFDVRAATAALASKLERHIAGRTWDVVGISIEDANCWPVLEPLCREVFRKVAPTLVAGGRGIGSLSRSFAERAVIDWVIFGEGELGFVRLLQHYANGAPLSTVPGLWRPGPDTRSRNPSALPDFRFHPPPDFTGLDLRRYRSSKPTLPGPYLPYLFILGCPYRCAFCSNDADQKSRYRPLAQAVEDLRVMRDRHGVRRYYFLNNLLNTTRGVLAEFLDAMERANLGIEFADCARPMNIDAESMRRLRAVGCVELTYGIDTGSQRLSNLMRKGYKIEKAVETLNLTAEAGIRSSVNLIVGMPHETEEDFEETLRFIERVRHGNVGFLVSPYVYNEGSPLFENPRAFGLRRRGAQFDELGGRSFREHLEARDRRFRTIMQALGYRARLQPGMPGFDEYRLADTGGPSC